MASAVADDDVLEEEVVVELDGVLVVEELVELVVAVLAVDVAVDPEGAVLVVVEGLLVDVAAVVLLPTVQEYVASGFDRSSAVPRLM